MITTQDQEDAEAHQQMLVDLQDCDCVSINEKDEVFFCGKLLGRKRTSWEDMFLAIRLEMKRHQYWPNVYRVNDHGNVDLLSNTGELIRSWV